MQKNWHFTLKLWHWRWDEAANLEQFDREWEWRRSGSAQTQAGAQRGLLEGSNDLSHTVADETGLQRQDWGEAIHVAEFYGRTEQLALLEKWIQQDRCQLLAVIGMGGMGKTTLTIQLAQTIQGEFEFWFGARYEIPPHSLTFCKI